MQVLRDTAGAVTRLIFSGYAYTRDPLTFTEMAAQ